MKSFLTSILIVAVAASACTKPDLEPQPQSEQDPHQPQSQTDPDSGNSTISVSVTTILLEPETLSLTESETWQLSATVQPEDAADKTVIWSSSNEEIASVKEGMVTAFAPGEADITATSGEVSATCHITVIKKVIHVEQISLNHTNVSLYVDEQIRLQAQVFPEDATYPDVVWSSSDETIASVDNGRITAHTAGTALISATADQQSATCTVEVLPPFHYGGMCLEAVADGFIIIDNPNGFMIDYKIENKPWKTTSDTYVDIVVPAGKHVWFRGLNESYTTGNSEDGLSTTRFICYNGPFYLYGNLMSLLYGDDFASYSEITGEYAFFKLFADNSQLINHPSLDIELPATTLSPSCYRNMFFQCSNLTRAPKLPAQILTYACYASMFAYCTSLTTFPEMAASDMVEMSCCWMMRGSGIEVAPELPAMILDRSCYQFMFMECPNLKKAMPILPATELAPNCYTGMFQRADKLENAPELPATKMKYSCYSHMFNGCKALKKAPDLPATLLAEACYQRMFGNSGLTEAPELPAMNMAIMCYQYMFEDATDLVKAPVLPAPALVLWCYQNMFSGCSKLNYIKMLATKKKVETFAGNQKLVDLTSTSISDCCPNWVNGVAEEGTFIMSPDAVWNTRGVNGIPEGWTVSYAQE